MVLLILSKGAQRRKSGEKRKDRKKEATEEEKGGSEEEAVVSAARSWTAVRAVLPSQRFVNWLYPPQSRPRPPGRSDSRGAALCHRCGHAGPACCAY